MKKLAHMVGLLASMSLGAGLTFKLLHWPGADELIIYGFLAFTLIFVPFQVTIQRQKMKSSMDKSINYFGLSSAGLTGFSVLFKLMHLQGADIFLVIGCAVFVLAFLPFLFLSLYKKSVA